MGPEGRMLLQQVLQSSDAHVRMRGLHLLMSSAGQGQANLHALCTSGTLSLMRPDASTISTGAHWSESQGLQLLSDLVLEP